MRNRTSQVTILIIIAGVVGASVAEIHIDRVPGQAELGTVEIRGVSAGSFDPQIWQEHRLHILPDVRSPLLQPRISGGFRNIYAPSAVELPNGWRLFYGAWDGVPTGNDRIYSVMTKDFLDFDDHGTVIEHGEFVHVCNVNAIRERDGSFRIVCTVYPDEQGQNKIAMFSSPDGDTWNGASAALGTGGSSKSAWRSFRAGAILSRHTRKDGFHLGRRPTLAAKARSMLLSSVWERRRNFHSTY